VRHRVIGGWGEVRRRTRAMAAACATGSERMAPRLPRSTSPRKNQHIIDPETYTGIFVRDFP
jgi:hypothetical protein